MDETRRIEFPPENESTEWLLRLQAWSHGGDALLLEAANELAALRKDAERYRWHKARNPSILLANAWCASKAACEIGDDPDAATDAAMAEQRALGAA